MQDIKWQWLGESQGCRMVRKGWSGKRKASHLGDSRCVVVMGLLHRCNIRESGLIRVAADDTPDVQDRTLRGKFCRWKAHVECGIGNDALSTWNVSIAHHHSCLLLERTKW